MVKGAKINFLWAGMEIVDLWDQWKDYKLEYFKFKYKTLQSEQAAFDNLVDLSGKDLNIATEIVKQSMANGWKGFFELKISQNKTLSGGVGNKYQNQVEAARKAFKPLEQ
jgi:hypothetical protein